MVVSIIKKMGVPGVGGGGVWYDGNHVVMSWTNNLYLEGRFNGEYFALPVWGAYIWRGLYMEELIF